MGDLLPAVERQLAFLFGTFNSPLPIGLPFRVFRGKANRSCKQENYKWESLEVMHSTSVRCFAYTGPHFRLRHDSLFPLLQCFLEEFPDRLHIHTFSAFGEGLDIVIAFISEICCWYF